jgi:hypothetical protein
VLQLYLFIARVFLLVFGFVLACLTIFLCTCSFRLSFAASRVLCSSIWFGLPVALVSSSDSSLLSVSRFLCCWLLRAALCSCCLACSVIFASSAFLFRYPLILSDMSVSVESLCSPSLLLLCLCSIVSVGCCCRHVSWLSFRQRLCCCLACSLCILAFMLSCSFVLVSSVWRVLGSLAWVGVCSACLYVFVLLFVCVACSFISSCLVASSFWCFVVVMFGVLVVMLVSVCFISSNLSFSCSVVVILSKEFARGG